jgi:nitrous oxidase accessory protein NosD
MKCSSFQLSTGLCASTKNSKIQASTVSTAPQTLEVSAPQQTDEGISRHESGSSKEDHVSRVPTEPAARRIFIQQVRLHGTLLIYNNKKNA